MPKVYNRRNGDEPNASIYVGRPSPWGNPYTIGRHGDRARVVHLYREYAQRPDFIQAVKKQLRGKDLVCWCAPEACHADVLLEIANATDIR